MRKLSRVMLAAAPAVLAVSALSAPATGGGIGSDPVRSPHAGASAGASAGAATPDRSVDRQPSAPITAPARAVKAVVVKSWGECSSDSLAWDSLNATWERYGTRPIVIDYAVPDLCDDSFTLAALEASGADVVILSDPTGGGRSYTSDEIAALRTYAEEGHDLIGTFLTFADDGPFDNPALAPLFGLAEDDGWISSETITPTYHVRVKHHAAVKSLFRDLGKRYVSHGFDDSQLPSDGVWSENERAGARIMAVNADGSAAITLYTGAGYNAVFISNMPEYFPSDAEDRQFLYNAIIYPGRG